VTFRGGRHFPAGGGVARRRRHRAVLGVALAVLAGTLLRAPLASTGLPYIHDPDEDRIPRVAAGMVTERRVEPGFYSYPGLVFDVAASMMVPVVPRDTDIAAETSPLAATQTQGNAVTERPRVILALRWALFVLPGAVAVAAAGAAAWLATRRWAVAGLAAGLVALSPLDLAFGRYMTPNALAGAAAGLLALAAVALLDAPRPARYVLAGAALGLAGAAKYNAVLVGVAIVVAHAAALAPEGWRVVLRRSWLLVVAGLTAAIVFLLLNPGVLLDWPNFRAGVSYEERHYRSGHPGNEGDALGFHLSALARSAGPALLMVPLGLLARDRRARAAAVVLAAAVVPYLAFISSFEVRFARNLLPVTVPLAAGAALGVTAVVDRVRPGARPRWHPLDPAAPPAGARPPGRLRPQLGVAVGAVVAAACLGWPLIRAVDIVDEAVPDPWAPAQRWLEAHVPAGSPVAVEDYGVHVDPERYQVGATRRLVAHGAAWYRDHGFVLLVAGERTFLRYLDDPERFPDEAAAYEDLLADTCTVFAAGPPGERVLLLDPDCRRDDPREPARARAGGSAVVDPEQ
jgi:hypothetical protein